jgi:hypothetical protein
MKPSAFLEWERANDAKYLLYAPLNSAAVQPIRSTMENRQ